MVKTDSIVIQEVASPSLIDVDFGGAEARGALIGRLYEKLVAPVVKRIGVIMVTLGASSSLYLGWIYRNEGHVTAETGIGYWLGIIGAMMMLALLIYPLRKRKISLAWLGPVSVWFRVHMLFGIAGPTLIILHSNYKTASLNGLIAFSTMLVVAISGLIGRYLYSKIHMGLYGRRAELKEMRENSDAIRHAFGDDFSRAPHIEERLATYERMVMERQSSFFSSIARVMSLGWNTRRCQSEIRPYISAALREQARLEGWNANIVQEKMDEANQQIRAYFRLVNKAAAYGFYERLFSLWHILHLPLFILMVLAAIMHVVAVHLY